MMASLASFLADLPLVDLHRHLDSTVRPATVLDLARQHGIALPAATSAGLRPWMQIDRPVATLTEFFQRFDLLLRIFVDYDAIYRVARENLEIAAAEGIDYVELRFSPLFMATVHHLD